MANPQVVVDFVANSAKLQQGINQASGATKGFGNSLKSFGKTAAVAAGAAGVAALVTTMKVGIGEFTEAAKVSAQTEAAIKSTGGAANVTADQIAGMAEALMKKSGVDDEAIQSGENLLLTFTKVQNQAGKGNDIFNKATETMLDMSVALGQDTTQSAMQLGKALNDPIKGMTALRRVGVTFTEAQQKQIKTMQESGDMIGAQKVILAELNKEFGGSAEALGKTVPGQVNILKQSFSNLAGDLVGKLMPAFTEILGIVTPLAGLIGKFAPVLVPIAGAIAAIVVATKLWAAAQLLLNIAMDANPIGAIILAITALGVAIYLIVKHWDTVKAAFQAAWDAIMAGANWVLDWFKANWPYLLTIIAGPFGLAVGLIIKHWDAVKAAVTSALTAITGAVTTGWNTVKTAILTVLAAIVSAVTTAWNTIKTAITTATSAIQTAVTSVWNTIKTTITTIMAGISSAVTTAWNTIKTNVTNALNTLKTTVTTVWNGIKTAITTVVGPITAAVTSIANAFKSPATAAQTMLSGIKTAFGAIAGAIEAVVGAVGRAAQKVANAIMAPINAAKGVVNGILSKFNALSIPGFSISLPSVEVLGHKIGGQSLSWGGYDLPDIPLLAKGGVVSRPTLVMAGEGRGREIIAPEALLRSIVNDRATEVRVFIGDQELRGLVRTEIVSSNDGLARTLLAGARA